MLATGAGEQARRLGNEILAGGGLFDDDGDQAPDGAGPRALREAPQGQFFAQAEAEARPNPTPAKKAAKKPDGHDPSGHRARLRKRLIDGGADALADIVGWRDPDGILARAHLVGVTRPGHVRLPLEPG